MTTILRKKEKEGEKGDGEKQGEGEEKREFCYSPRLLLLRF